MLAENLHVNCCSYSRKCRDEKKNQITAHLLNKSDKWVRHANIRLQIFATVSFWKIMTNVWSTFINNWSSFIVSYFSSVLIVHVLYIIPSICLILKSQYLEYDLGDWFEVIYTFNNFNSVIIVWKNYFSWCVNFDYFLRTKSVLLQHY